MKKADIKIDGETVYAVAIRRETDPIGDRDLARCVIVSDDGEAHVYTAGRIIPNRHKVAGRLVAHRLDENGNPATRPVNRWERKDDDTVARMPDTYVVRPQAVKAPWADHAEVLRRNAAYRADVEAAKDRDREAAKAVAAKVEAVMGDDTPWALQEARYLPGTGYGSNDVRLTRSEFAKVVEALLAAEVDG